MGDILAGIEMGKMQIDMVRNQMETEHFNLAQWVQMELVEQGYPCKIVEAGHQRFAGVKVKKWLIKSTDQTIDAEEFQKIKDKITVQCAKDRQAVMKEEMKELKKKAKEEKNNAKRKR